MQFDLRKLFRIPTPAQRLAGLGLRPDLYRAALDMVSDERSDGQLRALEAGLDQQEAVVAIVEGERDRQLGFLVLSTTRVLFRVHDTAPGRATTVPLQQISTVTDRARGMSGRVVIRADDAVLEVDRILGIQAAQFAQALRRQLTDPPPVVALDPVDALLELRGRRAAGTISEADYQAAKRRLLDEL